MVCSCMVVRNAANLLHAAHPQVLKVFCNPRLWVPTWCIQAGVDGTKTLDVLVPAIFLHLKNMFEK